MVLKKPDKTPAAPFFISALIATPLGVIKQENVRTINIIDNPQ
jgi:hypothetical protein